MKVPIKEIIKLAPHRRQVKKALGLDDELDDPPIVLQNMHFDRTNLGHEPFLLTLAIDRLLLYNYMLDSWSFANIMPLKVMHQLELDVTRPYRNVCGFDSRSILVHWLIKDLNVNLVVNKDISVLMDIIVIDIHDC